jgi:hypothetical protein
MFASPLPKTGKSVGDRSSSDLNVHYGIKKAERFKLIESAKRRQ